MPAKDTATRRRSSWWEHIVFVDPLSNCGVASVETAELLMQGTEKAKVTSLAIAGGVSEENLQNLEGDDDCR